MEQATVALRELPKAASAAERAAEKWSQTTKEAGRSSEEFSRRVRKTIADLEFERQQLARSTTERARYATLRRAGVAEASAEGQAILASVKALQAQQAALGHVALSKRAVGAATTELTGVLRTMLATLGPIALAFLAVQKVMEAFGKASGLDEAAEQIGVTAKNLQALQFAAAQGGVKMEQLDTGLTKFSQKMGEAAEGSKEMVEALTKLGVKNLDVAGNLRPTEDLLVDVAKAITNIDDPAKRAAAAVDFFGKAGTRMLPILSEIAGGFDAMGQKADEAGAIIDAKTIKILDNAADAMSRWSQIITAQLATALAHLLTIVDGVSMGLLRLADVAGAGMTKLIDSIEVGGAQAVAMFIEAFSAMPDVLGQVFTNAWEAARVATAKGINAITSLLPEWMGLGGTNLDTKPQGAGPAGVGLGDRINAAGEAAAQAMRDRQMMARQAAMQSDEDRARGGAKLGPMGSAGTVGAATSAVKGAGKEAEDAEKKYAKLITTLTQTATAQDQMTAAAGRGEVSFENMKVHLEAQQKSFEIYGKVLDDTDPKLRKIEELLLRISQGKAAEAFSTATTELQRQNEILEKQIELMGQGPEIIAKEIALIKARQEAEKGGTAITQEMIEARRQAIEQNEILKNQQAEIAKAQELWTAPLKSALESIQQTAADAFESMLQNGKFSFEELGATFKKIILRMAAEFLALATIRPIMSVVVNAIGGGSGGGGGGILGGLLGGMGSGNTGGGAGGILQSIGGTVLQSQGGIGGLFKGAGSWLGGLFGAGGGAAAASIPASALGGAASGFGGSIGTAAGAGSGFAAGGIGGGLSAGLAAIPVAGWIAAAAAIAKGILGPGDKQGDIKSSLSTLLGPSPEEWMSNPARSAFDVLGPGGPVGAAVMKMFGIHPFMEKPKIITNQASGWLNYTGGGFMTSGGAWGPDANSSSAEGPLQAVAGGIKSIFDKLGGVKDIGKVWSLGIEQFQQRGENWQFDDTKSFLRGPDGQREMWRQGMDSMADTGAAQVALRSILGGALGDISKNIEDGLKSLTSASELTTEQLSTTIDELMAFDDVVKNFGKTTTAVEDALQQIDESMQSLYVTAEKYGLDLVQLETEKNKQRLKVAEDFGENIRRQLLEFQDPVGAALQEMEREREQMLLNNNTLIATFGESQNKILQIEELFAFRRQEIMEAANAEMLAAQQAAAAAQLQLVASMVGSVSTIQDLIRELSPGGALSNLDPAGQLAGLRANAAASLAQAYANPTDAALVSRAVSDQRAFLDYNQSFTGGSTAYVRDAQAALGQLTSLQGAVTQGAMSGSNAATVSLLQRLLNAVQMSNDNAATRDADINTVMGLLARYLANPEAEAA